MKPITLLLAALFLAIFQGPQTFGQETRPLSLESIYRDGILRGERPPSMTWMQDGRGYVVLEDNEDTGGQDLVLVDPGTGKREVMIGSESLVPPGADKPLRVAGFDWSGEGDKVLLFTNTRRVWRYNTRGDYWVLDLRRGGLHRLGQELEDASLMFAKFSPDGSRVAYVSRHDLYVEDLDQMAITRLTFDGSERFINGTFDWVYEEDWGCRDGFRWSPDGQEIAYWHSDTEGTGTFYMVNNIDSVYASLIPLPYPKAGTTNSAVRIGVVLATGGQTRWFDFPGDPRDNYLVRMDYIPDSRELLVQQMNRLQNQNTVWVADSRDMSLRKIHTEANNSWVEAVDDAVWLPDGQHVTWTSEGDGWRHIYLLPREGGALRPVTRGAFDVIGIRHIDTEEGYVYYMASPDNPLQRYLFRSRLDGRGRPERISPADQPGQHRYQLSPDARYAIHTWEGSTRPPVTSLVRLPEHQDIRTYVDNAALVEELKQYRLSGKEFFRVQAGAQELDAWLIKPPDFDPDMKYPLIFYVYGEPASATVQDNWGGGDLWHEYLAAQGYLVASIDNSGTNTPRGSQWRKSIYGQIGILATHEQAAAARSMMQAFPFIDPERIGIWGWSGGGSMTLNCLFRYPDLYKAGIAVAFVSDQRLYNTVYQERYMGLPQGNPEGYRDGSPITHSGRLEGELLLIHGTADDNVHYQSLEMLADKLIAENKLFQMLAYPMRAHGISERENTALHLRRSMARFWERHLPAGPLPREGRDGR
jgi:dipeptidyl-peptidase-4